MTNGLITNSEGNKYWYEDGHYHRTDGPAIILRNGFEAWYIHGKLHREDGPALMYPSGSNTWWIHGDQYDPITWLLKLYELGLK